MADIETIALDTRYFAEAAAPATPDTGKVVVYAKADGLLYSKDDAGTETLVSSGTAGAAAIDDLTDVDTDKSKTPADGDVLTFDGTHWNAETPAAGSGDVSTDAIFDAKGDLVVGTGANTSSRLAIGTNDYVLTADSAEATGIKWAAASGGMTNPMTTAGDVIVGGASGTPARLAKGTDDQVLTMVSGSPAWAAPSGGVSSGTSNPGSPSSGDLFFRTDLGLMIYYDGTRWLTTNQYRLDFGAQRALIPSSTETTIFDAPTMGGDYALWLEKLYGWTYVVAPNSGSAYWTLTMVSNPAASTVASFNTSAVSAATHSKHSVTIGSSLATTEANLGMQTLRTGSPGNVYWAAALTYRPIIT